MASSPHDPTLWPLRPPWPHQAAGLLTCAELLAVRAGRGLVQMPTGTGKSRLMRALVYQLVRQRRRALIAVPTEEILQQLAADLRRETRTPFYLQRAQDRAPAAPLITIATHQTLWRRLDKHDPATVLLFDEAHHSGLPAATNQRTLRRFAHVLGFTASPWSEECEAIYQNRVLYHYPLSQAIAEGHLCPYELQPFPCAVPPPRQHELYYCDDNATARGLAAACPGAAYLGHDSRDRDGVVSAFRTGKLKRLYLNRMLTEGFDCPDVSTIYIDKASDSDILNYQMVGRGLRRKVGGRGLVVFAQDLAGVRAALARAG